MSPQPVGYFDYNGEQRYSDGKGGIYHNHLGPALNSVGNAFGIKSSIKGFTDQQNKRLNNRTNVPAPTREPIAPRLNTNRGPMFMDPVGPAPEMPGASSFMDPVAPKDADVTQLADKPGRQILPQEVSRTNANGVTQTGKSLSSGVSAAFVPEYANSSFNDLLAAQGTSQYNTFSSNQLPTTGANPFERTGAKTQAFNAKAPGLINKDIADFGGDESAAFASSRERTDRDTFNPDAARIEGASERPKSGRLDAALADKDGINKYMSKFSSGDQERAARRAFLDGDDSYAGLRARDAVNGVVYAGGQHYIDGGEGNPAQRLTDPQNARDIASGKAKAQDFLQKKVTETTAAAKQEPTVMDDGAISQSFKRDTPISATMPGDIGGSVEFDSNNTDAIKPFSAPKGYKPQGSRINTSITNPFGG